MKVFTTKKLKKNKGGIAIETALVFPPFIIIALIFIWQMQCIRSEGMLFSVLYKESEKIVIANISSDLLTSSEIYSKLTGEYSDIADVSLEYLFNFLAYEGIKKSYNELLSTRRTMRANIKIEHLGIEKPLTSDTTFLICDYTIMNPFVKKIKNFSIPISNWKTAAHEKNKNNENEKSVWSKNNFERGNILRKKFGGNLPQGYPVIAGYHQGRALSIRSMDLTKPSWSEPEAVVRELKREINKLRDFDGTNKPWGSQPVTILSGDIKQKRMRVIVPENSKHETYKLAFKELKNYCSSINIEFELIKYGVS